MKKTSFGERRLFLASVVGAAFGLVLSWSALRTLSWRVDVGDPGWTRAEIWLVVTGMLVMGGLILFMRKHFGHVGPLGLIRTVIAGVWVLFLTGVITGTLNMPIWGTTFGVIIIAGTLAKSPLLSLVCVGCLALIHWLCRPWQVERGSVLGFGETEY